MCHFRRSVELWQYGLANGSFVNTAPESGRTEIHQTRTFTADTHQIYASSDATISAASISMHIL